MKSQKWKKIFDIPGDHRLFLDEDDELVISDMSGDTPDQTNDGILYIGNEHPVTTLAYGIPVFVKNTGEEATVTVTPMCYSAICKYVTFPHSDGHSTPMNRDAKELAAKAFTVYKECIESELNENSELDGYNRIELWKLVNLAKKLDLVGDYFDEEITPKEKSDVETISPSFSVIVERDSGAIMTDLKEPCPYCNQIDCYSDCEESIIDAEGLEGPEDLDSRHSFNSAMNGVESMILAHAVAGINVTTREYLDGVATAVEACAVNL